MNYCAKESTLNRYEDREEVKDITIKANIQETGNILFEMESVLEDFAQIILGAQVEEKAPQPIKSVSCLSEESRFMVGLAYSNLSKLKDIKEAIV